MGWLATLFVAVVTAAFSALLSGMTASRVVDWYRIAATQGSAYFVIYTTLGGALLGLLLGAAVARLLFRSTGAPLGWAVATALTITLVLAVIVASTSRWLADVPPTLNGEKLMLLVEMRWPQGAESPPTTDGALGALELGALAAGRLRTSKQGPLWTQDAHLQDGHWTVPGAVEVFTNRGTRVLSITTTTGRTSTVTLPMQGSPQPSHLDWSAWLPWPMPDGVVQAEGFSYRFKVVVRSAPSRTETLGAFQVETIASAFYVGDTHKGQPVFGATAQFALHYKGRPLTLALGLDANEMPTTIDRVEAVATLPGLPTALLVRVEPATQPPSCWMLVDQLAGLRQTRVSGCELQLSAEPLTNDPAWLAAARERKVVLGRIDRQTFMHPGAYLFEEAVFDSALRTLRSIDSMPPCSPAVGTAACRPQ